METPALTVRELARHMQRQVEAALDDDLRCTGDTDQTMLGRLTQLDVICDALWITGDTKMTGPEEAELAVARKALGKAWDYLEERINRSAPAMSESVKVPL